MHDCNHCKLWRWSYWLIFQVGCQQYSPCYLASELLIIQIILPQPQASQYLVRIIQCQDDNQTSIISTSLCCSVLVLVLLCNIRILTAGANHLWCLCWATGEVRMSGVELLTQIKKRKYSGWKVTWQLHYLLFMCQQEPFQKCFPFLWTTSISLNHIKLFIPWLCMFWVFGYMSPKYPNCLQIFQLIVKLGSWSWSRSNN